MVISPITHIDFKNFFYIYEDIYTFFFTGIPPYDIIHSSKGEFCIFFVVLCILYSILITIERCKDERKEEKVSHEYQPEGGLRPASISD
jgi:hypothetical protein